MKKAIRKVRGGKRPGSGRKPTGVDPARTIRLSDDFIAMIDAWSVRQVDNPSRSEAIRRLVELGLKVKTGAKSTIKPGLRLRAMELAAKAIEGMIDPAAPPEERAQRRRRLTKGPLEFREHRVDLPKAKGK
jgi:hypothetical protein